MAKTEALPQTQSSLPVGGVLVKALISAFTQKPHKGDDSWSTCSVGVAHDSIVATDTHSAIIIGKTQSVHEATQRKEVLIDCERSKLYGEAIPIDDFARLVDKASGKVEIMPDIGRLVSKEMATMKSIGAVDPSALQRIGTIAAAAGAGSVELFQQESGDAKTLGFTFKFRPRDEHQNLFQTWEGEIDARGVIVVREGSGAKWDTLEDEEKKTEAELEPEPKPKAKAKKAKSEPIEEGFCDPEPDSPSVSFLRLESSVDPSETRDKAGFKLPALATLAPDDLDLGTGGEHRDAIIATLRDFNIVARVVAIHVGPTVTQYEIEIQKGVPGKRVAALADDLQRALAVKSIRIEAPIPGKSAIGIELPNAKPQKVSLRSLAGLNAFLESDKQLLVGLGLNVSGDPVYADLEAMPHLLIGGATNSGKSIAVASILASLLMRNTPHELRLVLIDPKRVELALFDDIPHLMREVVTDMAEVPGVLESLVEEMEVRYNLLKEQKVRNITGYNEKAQFAPDGDPHDGFDPLPRIVVVIDELADLMMQFGDECEDLIVRLAQKARAVGIHLVIATQRPSVDVVTGLIKANMPSRIALAVAQMVDSRVVIDQPGAERLLGRGDMLFAPVEGGGKTIRVQGCYISEGEVEALCEHWKAQGSGGSK